ncbi:uncharacterized protein EI90DRAFT_180243 [Cantharellus anzutake]|uniref:uncharacterized protein n=1 Tax=Cantharellus anzutake TaxID=1750568 RepID=UPI0019088D24|nr:uncharacterized protein EI90DRAFT_180243 [Cantharellus anzutake]KAF8336494.1 hypothetical protein EI90DRAFT_180243 [Cantharellus anzutake]
MCVGTVINFSGVIYFFQFRIAKSFSLDLRGLLSTYALSGDLADIEQFRRKLSPTSNLSSERHLLSTFKSASYHDYDPTGRVDIFSDAADQLITSAIDHTTSWSVTILLAEVATFQMEFKYFARLTGRKEYLIL